VLHAGPSRDRRPGRLWWWVRLLGGREHVNAGKSSMANVVAPEPMERGSFANALAVKTVREGASSKLRTSTNTPDHLSPMSTMGTNGKKEV
jgi:hypothetical protein